MKTAIIVLLHTDVTIKKGGVPGENHRSVASHYKKCIISRKHKSIEK